MKLFKRRIKDWKIKFYLNGQYVCSQKVDDVEDAFNRVYVVTILFKCHFFKSLFVRTVIKPDKLLFKDVIKKELHIGAYLFEGVKV